MDLSRADEPSLSWARHPTRQLISLSWPICLSTLSQALYTVTDTWFVAHLGDEALAAASLGGVLFFSIIWFSLGVLASVKLKVSEERGADPNSNPDLWIFPGFRLALLLSLGSIFVLAILSLVVVDLAETAGAGQSAREYILLRGLGTLLCLFAGCLRESMFGESESKLPLYASLLSTLGNIALDALFIFYLEWGVAGAALGTALAYGIDLCSLYLFDRRRRQRLGRPAISWRQLWPRKCSSQGDIRSLWALGWPIGTANFLEVGAFTVLTAIIARVGNLALAAHQIALQTMHFAFLPILAVGEGASIMVSEAHGAGQHQWILGMAKRCLAVVIAFNLVIIVLLVFYSPVVAALFSDDPALVALTVQLFNIAALFQLSDGFNIIGRCILRGAQDLRFVSYTTISLTWGITCPLSYALVLLWDFGAAGAWWAILVEVSLVALILWIRLFYLQKSRLRPSLELQRRTATKQGQEQAGTE